MVKIEQLKNAKAVFTRDGTEQPILLGAILTDSEFKTMKVLSGTVVVSIDEQEVITISYKETPVSKQITIVDVVVPEITEEIVEIKSPEQTQLNVATSSVVTPKKIIQPKAKQTK